VNILRLLRLRKQVSGNPILNEAHPQGGFTTQLDNKVKNDLAKVEDLPEQHAKMMDACYLLLPAFVKLLMKLRRTSSREPLKNRIYPSS